MLKHLKLFAAAIVAASLILAITSFWNDSVIVDEVPHIGAGYSYLVKQDMRLNPEHPPLGKIVGALPLVFMDLEQPAFGARFWTTDVNGQWEFGRNLIYNSGNDAIQITRAVKFPMLLFFIFSAILIFVWALRLYGPVGAAVALILFCFSPTVLTHSRFVTTDMPALFGVLLATFFFVRYLKEQTRRNMLIASVAFGIALLTKFSTFLLVPFLGLTAVVWGLAQKGGPAKRFRLAIEQGLRSVLVFAVGFVLILWPVYGILNFNYPPERQKNDTTKLLSSFGNRTLADPVVWASDKPAIRAAGQYFLGLLMVVQRSAGGNTTYFLGEVSRFGWRHYFPVIYFLKEPLAWWGFVIIALGIVVFRVKKAVSAKGGSFATWLRTHFEEFVMLLWLAIYWFTSIRSTLNIGVRHLLPTYPFAIMLASGQIALLADYLSKRKKDLKKLKILGVATAALVALYVYDSTSVHPFYLTYFNQVAGGPSGGYWYAVDSNLDWGQDLKRLSDWVEENDIKRIEFDYFGWADPSYYMGQRYIWMNSTKYKDAADFMARNRSDGWLAVSATFLQGSQGSPDQPNNPNYSTWLRSFTPVTVIGNSIFVYHITP